MTQILRIAWVHVHIIKCGGTTFNQILQRNHQAGYATTTTLLNDQYSANQVLTILKDRPEITCLTGHRLSLDLPWGEPDIDLRVSTFIRDPIERFISHYFYHRHKTQMVPQARQLNLSDYTSWALEERNQPGYVNGQLRFLTGESTSTALQEVRDIVARGRFYLLPLSRFDESLTLLRHSHKTFFEDCRYERLNTSPRDESVTLEQRELISKFCELDIELYQTSQEALDTQLKCAFPTQGAIESALRALHSARTKTSLTYYIRRKLASLLTRAATVVDP